MGQKLDACAWRMYLHIILAARVFVWFALLVMSFLAHAPQDFNWPHLRPECSQVSVLEL